MPSSSLSTYSALALCLIRIAGDKDPNISSVFESHNVVDAGDFFQECLTKKNFKPIKAIAEDVKLAFQESYKKYERPPLYYELMNIFYY